MHLLYETGLALVVLTNGPQQALGYVISFALFGVLVVQIFIYHARFTRDPPQLRVFVWTIALLEILSCIFAIYGLWQGSNMHCLSCVPTGLQSVVEYHRYGLSDHLLFNTGILPMWSFVALAALTGLTSSLVHGFFCWRLWIIGKSAIVPIAVMTVSSRFSCFLGGIKDNYVDYIWLGGSLVCDIVITIQTTRLLFQQNSRTNFQNTKSLITKLIKLTIETGMVTAVATLLELLMAVFLNPIAHLAVNMYINNASQSYANCLMATLNARLTLPDDSVQSIQVSTALFRPGDTSLTDAEVRIDHVLRRRALARMSKMSDDPEHGFDMDLLQVGTSFLSTPSRSLKLSCFRSRLSGTRRLTLTWSHRVEKRGVRWVYP
ncbi:hypothetical protein BV22DRAFT_1001709 [Leucogyrophana mollusca]|uniref:Uncharacterized protein n=1 Tax=Leucogyrophana mollusca TaxID=85980 RepID=A0ACB8BW49_9AGAM|nr:hypothetical protein BV22DRAFT_1001709 [Leucogyrophana mollusca]